ncbi:MAG: DUF2073 domain-containing protein [Nanoarchaeota archaeon]
MLTIQYVPYSQVKNLDSDSRIKRLLRIVREDKIVLMEGMLNPGEETKLIQETMSMVNGKFKGVEVCTIQSQERMSIIKKSIFELLGTKSGMTIIGPASIIKEIKRDPNKIQLLTQSPKRRR